MELQPDDLPPPPIGETLPHQSAEEQCQIIPEIDTDKHPLPDYSLKPAGTTWSLTGT